MLSIGIFKKNNRDPILVEFNLVSNMVTQMGPTRDRLGVCEPMMDGWKEGKKERRLGLS